MSHEPSQPELLKQSDERTLKLLEEFGERILEQLDGRIVELGDRLCCQIDDIGNRIQGVTDGSHLRSPNNSSGLVDMMHSWQRETSPWTCQKEWGDH